MKINYVSKRFNSDARDIIYRANVILEEMVADGYTLTLRQLYYQFVARAMLSNNLRSYKKLGRIVSEARLAGLIDWRYMVDLTRSLTEYEIWNDPHEAVETTAEDYRIDHWVGQNHRLEVWVEKDALIGVIARACNPYQVPYFSCRGYVSQSAMWRAAQRLEDLIYNDYHVTILHLGDHDPSGVDMTRDIEKRLSIFLEPENLDYLRVNRIALNMDQIRQYQPPPDYAKMSDSRGRAYVEKYGDKAWELDALKPQVIVDLIKSNIEEHIDNEQWTAVLEREKTERVILNRIVGLMEQGQ